MTMTPPTADPAEPQDAVDSTENAEAASSTTLPDDFDLRVEAALITAERPMSAGKLAEALGLDASKPVSEAIDRLNTHYEDTGRSFRIEQVAGGYRVLTLPAFGDVMAALHRKKDTGKLSPAALETLAVVAYKQPVLRTGVEAIRGVACGEVLRALMERHLVKIVGRAEEPGRPMLYGTTKQFLEVFGLSSLKDLPDAEGLNP
ncbi:MAG: SMC-Scp complex subunit ScpB [Planctomycetota bacterium]